MAFSLFELFAANMVMNDVAKVVDAHERAHREEISRLSRQVEQMSYDAEQYREIANIQANASRIVEAYNSLVENYNGLAEAYRDLEKKIQHSLMLHRDSLMTSRNFMDENVRNLYECFIAIRSFVRNFKAEADSKNFSEEDLHAAFYFRAAFYKILKEIDGAIFVDGTDEEVRNKLNGTVESYNNAIKNYETVIKSYD